MKLVKNIVLPILLKNNQNFMSENNIGIIPEYSLYTGGLINTSGICTNSTTTIYNNPTLSNMMSWSQQSHYIPEPDKIDNLKQLRNYCCGKDIDEVVFNNIEELLPFGVDALSSLVKLGIKSEYINKLLRTKKLKRII